MMFSVLIPTLNERAHIRRLVTQVLADADSSLVEIIIADGGSTDGTVEIAAELAAGDRRVRVLSNPKRLQAAALNLASAHADPRSDILVRLDAHAIYPPGFPHAASQALVDRNADSVVVRLRSHGETCFQKAVAAAGNSVLGTGGAVHRVGGASRWIDHGHHAAFRRATFQRVGGYDESFPANEDAEFDVRLRQADGRIWFEADLEVTYLPRRTPASLAKQYFRYGMGRARNFRKHDERLRARQLVAPALLVVLTLALLAAPITGSWTLLLPLIYLLACLAAGVWLAGAARDACLIGVAVALPAMHLSWGSGFLLAILRGRRSSAPGQPASRAKNPA